LNDVAVRTLPTYGLPPGGPTYAGFQWFVANIMGVPGASIPPDSWMEVAYTMAVNLCYTPLLSIPSDPSGPSVGAIATYNLGAAYLCGFAQDDQTTNPPGSFWSNLQQQYGINSTTFGMVTSASDQGTADSLYIPNAIKNMTFNDLWLSKTPWGSQYLRIAGQWGYIWDITY